MSHVRRRDLGYANAGEILDLLSSWTPMDRALQSLHPGDVGWQLRFTEAAFHLWLEDDVPIAGGFMDGPVLRVTLAPGNRGKTLLPEIERLVGDGEVWCDGLDALADLGWTDDPDAPWFQLARPAPGSPSWVPDIDPADVADRVAVQRAAFEGSTFTVERWHAMRHSPAGPRCVEAIVRTPSGEAAAAVTGWLAGPGQCALIEPMGTHPEHRGHGYGKQVLAKICDALAARGASAIAVATPSSNTAAVALYRSAGFEVIEEFRARYRPARDIPL